MALQASSDLGVLLCSLTFILDLIWRPYCFHEKKSKKNSKEKHFKCAYGQDRIIVDDKFCTTLLDVAKKDGVLP